MKRETLVVIIFLAMITSGSLVSLGQYPREGNEGLSITNDDEDIRFDSVDIAYPSDQNQLEGELHPVVIEQTGNKTITTLHAETDSKTNVKTNLSIDVANDWVGRRVSVDLWNLKRLYIENGSLNEGIVGSYPFGWSPINGSPDSSMLLYTDYINQEISVTARGYRIGGNYFFANGTYIYWIQSVNNTPYLQNFIFNFDYVYDLGPDANPNVTLCAYIDDILIWNVTTATLLTSIWNNSGDIPVNLTGVGSQFEFRIGLYLNGDLFHDKQWIQFTLDNIEFIGATPPTFDDSAIKLNIGQNATIITGTSFGQASIINSSLWRTENVLIELTAPLSYSFDYFATMASSRFINSTKSLNQGDDGVRYTSQLNGASLLEFYTFIGVLPDIDDFTLIFKPPNDWENVTVYNPFGTQVTSFCDIVPGRIVVPTSQLNILGWWEVHMNSPNYVHNFQTLKFDESFLSWFPDSQFRTTNITKASIEIGGINPIPTPPQDVNITWIRPEGTKWFTESISSGVNGEINSTQLEFGPTNTTAGLWKVIVYWTNGTELAFGSTTFELYHEATLSPQETIIETERGLSVTNFVYYRDSDNNQFLMDPAVSITANWSSTTVTFVSDPIQNRWVGVFDTSLVEPGNNTVIVNASRPFFDDVYCTFYIEISYTGNHLMIDTLTAEIGLGDIYTANFNYTDAFGLGISDANVSIEFEGPAGGIIWTDTNDIGGGAYSVEFTAVHSGDYVITISASKAFYEEASSSLFVDVRERTTNLSLENGTAAIISFGNEYRLVLRYTNGTGFGLDGANVTVMSIIPEAGINYTEATNDGDGYYSILLSPTNTGTYTLLIRVSLSDHSQQLTSFTLTATVISTRLRITGASTPASVGVAQPFELLIFYEKTGGVPTNITLATLRVNFTSFESLDYTITPLAEGYLISFQTDKIGSYDFTIYANKTGYQSDFESFTLFIRERGMKVIMDPPVWVRLSDLNISLRLIEVDTDLPVSDANVTYRLVRFFDVVMEGFLTETSTGVYSIFIRPDWYDGSGYSLRIFAEKENFALDQDYEFVVVQTTPSDIAMQIFLETYLPPIIGIAAVSIVSLSGRAIYLRRKKAELAVDLANKRRFDDADNIIGVIVMHKRSGIPIYSRIFKGGFEEGIVAAFISAVTHFREEFEMLEEESMKVIPISDIIRAVQTPNLICAFVTVRSASIEHNRNMEAYARQVSNYLDDLYADSTPSSTTDSKIDEILDYIFDETMDGHLLKFHKLAKSGKLPKRYQVIEKVMLDMETIHCSKPIYLAKAVSKYGVSEARGCTLVSEAIEKGFLIKCESHEIQTIEIDFSKFLDKDTSAESD
ncbi:MAG: hypothetical protein ACFFCX_09575 [Candidatus Sifarchaeia archaeon]